MSIALTLQEERAGVEIRVAEKLLRDVLDADRGR